MSFPVQKDLCYCTFMSPATVMIISGLISAAAGTTTLVSGAIFKRAFDQYHQKQVVYQAQTKSSASDIRSDKTAVSHNKKEEISIGSIHSINQKGGITAGYVGKIDQSTSK